MGVTGARECCPACRAALWVPASELLGERRCPRCGTDLWVVVEILWEVEQVLRERGCSGCSSSAAFSLRPTASSGRTASPARRAMSRWNPLRLMLKPASCLISPSVFEILLLFLGHPRRHDAPSWFGREVVGVVDGSRRCSWRAAGVAEKCLGFRMRKLVALRGEDGSCGVRRSWSRSIVWLRWLAAVRQRHDGAARRPPAALGKPSVRPCSTCRTAAGECRWLGTAGRASGIARSAAVRNAASIRSQSAA